MQNRRHASSVVAYFQLPILAANLLNFASEPFTS
jgi:hypothetical protein